MTKIALLFAVLLATFGFVFSDHSASAQDVLQQEIASTEAIAEKCQAFRPQFVASDCWFLKAGEAARPGMICGTVQVPEDRTNPASGLISIAIMKVAAVSQPAPSGTLIWLENGPGEASIFAWAREGFAGRMAGLHQKSDLLFIDQRGTGYSQRDFCRTVRDALNGNRVLPPLVDFSEFALLESGGRGHHPSAAERRKTEHDDLVVTRSPAAEFHAKPPQLCVPGPLFRRPSRFGLLW